MRNWVSGKNYEETFHAGVKVIALVVFCNDFFIFIGKNNLNMTFVCTLKNIITLGLGQ